MSNLIWHNGRLMPEGGLAVPPLNRAMLYGDGVFETMLARGRQVFRCHEHIERLQAGLRTLSIRETFSPDALREGIDAVTWTFGGPDMVVRIIAWRGGPDGPDPDPHAGAAVIIFAKALDAARQARCRQGLRGRVVSLRRNNRAGLTALKSLSYLDNIAARIEARTHGADEAIFLNIDDQLAEGATSNIFLVERGALLTPPPEAGILAGITRRAVLQCARDAGIPCREEACPPARLFQAQEAFLTNAVMGIMPLVQADAVVLGGGAPGPLTGRLMKMYADLVARESCLAQAPAGAGERAVRT